LNEVFQRQSGAERAARELSDPPARFPDDGAALTPGVHFHGIKID
jgi:hypothetical protein